MTPPTDAEARTALATATQALNEARARRPRIEAAAQQLREIRNNLPRTGS